MLLDAFPCPLSRYVQQRSVLAFITIESIVASEKQMSVGGSARNRTPFLLRRVVVVVE